MLTFFGVVEVLAHLSQHLAVFDFGQLFVHTETFAGSEWNNFDISFKPKVTLGEFVNQLRNLRVGPRAEEDLRLGLLLLPLLELSTAPFFVRVICQTVVLFLLSLALQTLLFQGELDLGQVFRRHV